MKNTLLSSAPTMELIKESIARYFYGGGQELKENHKGRSKRWNVYKSTGEQIEGVIVTLKAKRYRFELLLETK